MGCVTVYKIIGFNKDSKISENKDVSFPAHKGEKTRIAVLLIAIDQKAIADHPAGIATENAVKDVMEKIVQELK